jgi:hypothetical protein
MKNFAYALGSLLLLTICLSSPAAGAARATIEFDLDGDGRRESIVLDGEKELALSVRRNGKTLWQGVTARWQPWKLMVADVDGDGMSEIVVGVYKATRFFPRPHNCLFIYGWDGRRAYPKWLGSSLSKPFTDFAFADFNGDGQDELIALETRLDGLRSVAVYSWNGFGFTLDWQRGAWGEASLITEKTGSVAIEADGERIALIEGARRKS